VASTNPGYTIVQTAQRASGTAAYQLAHPSPRADQTLLLPETFHVTNASAAVTFSSRLGLATGIQVARVQASTDDGVSWSDIYAQTRSASLSAYVGRTIRVRFAYTIDGSGSAFPQTDPAIVAGWFIDNITLGNVQSVTPGTATRVSNSDTFTFSPANAGSFTLQARGVLFDTFPLEWGPLAQVTAAVGNGPTDNSGRLINLSVLTGIASAGDSFTLGYVVGGLNGGAKPLVIRAAGPSLGALGVPNTLGDPRLELFASETKTGENDNWGGSTAVRDAMAAVGAFAYTGPTSLDATAATSITTRDNSVKVSAAGGGTGTVIAEIYDATPRNNFTSSTPRLVNVSVLKHIGSGLTAGFVIDGGAKTVLVRAIGPTLASLFNIGTAVSDPQLTLFGPNSSRIDGNDNWGGTAALNTAFGAVGAFSLATGSRDAAIVATLQPGNYTVEVTGVNGATGTALVEIYDVP
jgi:hypothetical protein